MGILDWIRKKPKFVAGYEIAKSVKCSKCHQTMYIPKGWADTPRSAGKGPARDGNQCPSCGNYICENCMPALHSGSYRCCQNVAKGVQVICYFPSSEAVASKQIEREQAKEGHPVTHIKQENRDEKRREWIDKAQELKKQGQHEKSFEYLDKVIFANLDTNGYARHLKGATLMEQGRYEEAANCISDALKADPESDTYRFDLGRVLYELGRLDEARLAFEKVAKDSFVYGLDKKANDWIKKIQTHKLSFSKEEPFPIVFESLNAFKKLIRENYNLSNSKLEGTIEADTLIKCFKKIKDDISLYWNTSNTFAHSSIFQILVFPRNEFGNNMGFIGLATFNPGMLDKSLQEFKLSKNDIGLIRGQVMSRFEFSMFHDNSARKEYVEKHFALVSVDELENLIDERRKELGIK